MEKITIRNIRQAEKSAKRMSTIAIIGKTITVAMPMAFLLAFAGKVPVSDIYAGLSITLLISAMVAIVCITERDVAKAYAKTLFKKKMSQSQESPTLGLHLAKLDLAE